MTEDIAVRVNDKSFFERNCDPSYHQIPSNGSLMDIVTNAYTIAKASFKRYSANIDPTGS